MVEQNIDALVKMRLAEERKKGRQERIADALTMFSGSMLFVYVHAIWFRRLDRTQRWLARSRAVRSGPV